MRRLSSKPSELKPEVAVVVVGSGYGGGVAASRLARAGLEVCVLERGRELQPGEFPDTEREGAEQSQLTMPGTKRGHVGSKLALFDWHVERDFNVLVGCGLGGTSLINANVALEADPKVFEDPRWPQAIRDDPAGLREGYARAKATLESREYPRERRPLAKLDALFDSAEAMGERCRLVPINVSFEDRINPFGVAQSACTGCGDCVTGCNVGAKNTVAMNYLPDAWNHGARIFTEISVDHIEACADGRWAVHYTAQGVGSETFGQAGERTILAETVILAAGTLGTTKILLRSRERGLALSSRLGQRFSGNADVIGFSYNCDRPINGIGAGTAALDPEVVVGPTITAIIDGRRADRPLGEHFVIEDAALPGAIDAIYPCAFEAAAASAGIDTDRGVRDALAERARVLRSRLPGGLQTGALANTQTLLGMGIDSGAGVLRLSEDLEHLSIDWPEADREAVIERVNAKMVDATAALGGTYVPNPAWSNHFESSLITVHPLGGCSMAEDASTGVVNHEGQVFAGDAGTAVHAGLYVNDGAMIPMPIGINPLLTIAGLAERNMARLVAASGLELDCDPHARPSATRPEPGPCVGLSFTERMAGYVAPLFPALLDDQGQPDYDAAHEAGEAAGHAFAFVLTLAAEDLDATLADTQKRMSLDGTVEAPGLSPAPLQVSEGRFHCLSEDPDQRATTNMIYVMRLEAEDGRSWQFHGRKYVHDDLGPDLWSDTTTLYVELRDARGTLTHAGRLHIGLADFARQLTTMDVRGTDSRLERLAAMARFGRFFAGSLFSTYADLAAGPTLFAPEAPPRKRRPLRAGPPSIHTMRTSDGVSLCLTRYQGGTKGPVVLCHGLGVSSRIFTLDTIDTNLVEYLYAHGYDIWLLDYRASIELPSATRAVSGDAIATIDYPEAVAEVRRLSGAESVQMVVHCYGSTLFFMAMLSGKLEGVRAAVASQVGAHVETAGLVRLKSGLHLPEFLDAIGVDKLDAYTDTDAPWYERLYDRALEHYPVEREERCASATCHRISFMYSLLYEHDQLSRATHDTLHELFGPASITAFEHLATMVRHGQLVDAAGRDVYLPHVERLALPLRLIVGAENACYRPQGMAKTHAWLREHNDPTLYSRVEIPDHGHIDCIFGKRAATSVYPHILDHLEAHPAPAPAPETGTAGPTSSSATSLEATAPRVDALVIGSGFGGSINALRLAEAGRSVVVLERGRRYAPRDFPRNVEDVDTLLWRYPDHARSRGLYDLRMMSGAISVTASGVGGGSLIYASIHYRPQAAIFNDPRWPEPLSRAALEPYYAKVEAALGVETLPAELDLAKRDRFHEAAATLERPCFDTPQAVSWTKVFGHGEGRTTCQLCAECEFGCPHGSKNTLDFTYLAEAEARGARVETNRQVSHIAPAPGGGWLVHYEDTRTGETGVIIGERVVVAAGTLGTAEILLRSRDEAKTLPKLSPRLGHGYSANGDFLGNIQNAAHDLEPWRGPDVTSVMWHFDSRPGFALATPTFNQPVMNFLASLGQAPPNALASMVAGPAYSKLDALLPWAMAKGLISQPLKIRGKHAGPANRFTTVFAIGEDNAGGRLVLREGKLDLIWNYAQENRELIASQEAAMRGLARAYGGTYGNLATWDLFQRPMTVHNLGGCVLSRSADEGVVDIDGQVHGHPGLFVADGSVIPTAIGSHPVMTISAVAEWIAERVVASFGTP